jgi:CcmD family protein
VNGNWVVMGVSLLTWAATFFYLLRLERRIKDLEKS